MRLIVLSLFLLASCAMQDDELSYPGQRAHDVEAAHSFQTGAAPDIRSVIVEPGLPHSGFVVPWKTVVPVRDFIYFGDNPPACTTDTIHQLAYSREKVLSICTGPDRGWQVFVIEDRAVSQKVEP